MAKPAPKKESPAASLLATAFAGRWLNAKGRGVIVALASIALLLGGFQYAWHRWGKRGVIGRAHVITAADIEATPQPEWLHAEVKSEILRDVNITGSSILDTELTKRIHAAFASHRWISKVRSVKKSYPAKVEVDLDYRQPIAVVEVQKSDGKPGLVFIDADTALLSHADLAPGHLTEKQADSLGAGLASGYLRITGGKLSAAGKMYGHSWENQSLLGAAQIANAWKDQWKSTGLFRIAITEDTNADIVYEMLTKDNHRIVWGHAPGQEVPGEPKPAEKIQQILTAIKKQGSLSSALEKESISDFRPVKQVRTAKQKADVKSR